MKMIFKLGFMAFLAFFAPSCGGGGADGDESANWPMVKARKLAPSDLTLSREYTGYVAGQEEVEVRAQVDGLLLKKLYQEGNWVEKGQELFQIDDSQYQAAVDQAKAQLSGAESRRDSAEKDLSRAKNLYERQSIAKRELDSAESDYESAKAEAEAAEASLKEATVRWEKTKVLAPVSGYAGAALQMEGSLISSSSAEASLLTKISDTSSVRVLFSVPEAQVRNVRRILKDYGLTMDTELAATLLIDQDEVYAQTGRMEYGDATVDRQSGAMLSRAVFPNPDSELFNGQIVRIRLDLLTIPQKLALPQTAVMQKGGGQSVAVVADDGTVSFQTVECDGPIDSFFIIKSGLEEGQTVVVEGIEKAGDGQKVQVAEESGESEGGEAS